VTTVTSPNTPHTDFRGLTQIVTDNPEFKPNLTFTACCEGALHRL